MRARLEAPCDIVVVPETEIAAHLSDVDVLVTMAFSAEMAAAARRLKLVQVPGAELDRIDRAALPEGAWLANAYGHEIGIAEYVVGAMLTLTREYGRLDAALRRGVWESQWAVGATTRALWPERAGKTLGILGYGRIGQALALLGGPETLDDVLRRADYLAITLSLNESTRNLLGARELGLMQPTAFLVNVARAELVDETALYRALADRTIAGAALDVWYRYPTAPGATPPAHHPFHELPNVLMTPHVSGWTEGMLTARAKVIAENVGRAARGEPPLNLIP
ncbi:MAG: hypothetical protein FJZ38_06380 [Candidatus Rokubacteria bacterium]|nr:hypothetical protein [Candidatus Rokubacteria bacterium]